MMISNRASPVRNPMTNDNTTIRWQISNGTSKKFPTAFTLTELVISAVASVIVISTVGIILADSHRGWNKMYMRVYGDVVTDAYVAKKAFNAVVRESSVKRIELGDDGEFVKVYYYQDLTSEELDRYAKFCTTGEKLLVDCGVPAAGESSETLYTIVLAHNVKAANFSVNGASVQMILKLDNGKEALTVTCSAVRHNK